MNGYCLSNQYCRYKSDTGYCGYTAGCVLDNVATIKVPKAEKYAIIQKVELTSDCINAIADAVVERLNGEQP